VSLSSVRRELKSRIEALLGVDGHAAFEVWINEEATPAPGDETSWTHCIEQAKRCDLFIAIFNGQSGWADVGDAVGICEAELEAALTQARSKVSVVRLDPMQARQKGSGAQLDQRFIEYVEGQDLFRGTAADSDALISLVLQTVQERIVDLALTGARIARSARAYQGQALDWSLMTFAERKSAIERVLCWTLERRPDSVRVDDTSTVIVQIARGRVAMCCSGVPAGLAVAAAREMVGQPFLRDHEEVKEIDRTTGVGDTADIGPVHVIGCHGGVTESQARRHLGFADAAIVSTIAGIWVADGVQKMQVFFLPNCVDEVSTSARLEAALDWLATSGEDARLLGRAVGRARIARSIADQMD
jgi:hypothetical protein